MCDAVTTPFVMKGVVHAFESCEGHLKLNRLSLVVDRELEVRVAGRGDRRHLLEPHEIHLEVIRTAAIRDAGRGRRATQW
jgi:hypothetical protein